MGAGNKRTTVGTSDGASRLLQLDHTTRGRWGGGTSQPSATAYIHLTLVSVLHAFGPSLR